MTYKEFAKIMKFKRQQLNITQKEMANRLLISNGKYNKIENGLREPDFELLLKIAKELNISLDLCIKKEKPKHLYFD
jgi:transcriptional regulator with XRE-family HTH domain